MPTLPYTACAEFDQSLKVLGLPSEEASSTRQNLRGAEGRIAGWDQKRRKFDRQGGWILSQPGDQDSDAGTVAVFRKGPHTFGFGPEVDAFVMSMNRAAERATPQAM